ncbi:MAG: LysR family transcriptional regulator [Candidatus Aureabacteria bacterium]|nr:LysR family transcriptional regulator [Candidatus Auribacterota bacterium]
MQIETLKIFCDVARLGSFSKSAEQNSVTQSTVSQAVQLLEESLHILLIDRAKRPWKLTSEGRFFYEGCRDILDRFSILEQEVKGIHDETSSIVRVASIYSVGLRHMKYFVQKFSELYPKTTVKLDYLHPDKVYESILAERSDIGIVSFPHSKRELTAIPWKSEQMVLACHPDHHLAKQKKIPFSKLHKEKFVAFDKGLVIRREIDRFLKNQSVKVDIVLEFDNIESIKEAVEIASGIAILPEPTLDREVKSRLLCSIPFQTNELVRPLGIIHRKGKKFNQNVFRFITLLQEKKQIKPALKEQDPFY